MCGTDSQCDPFYGRNMDEQQHRHSHSDERRSGDGRFGRDSHFNLYTDIRRMFEQHVIHSICESFSTGSGYDHTADLHDADRECGVERFAIDRNLDIDADAGRNNLYREWHELYGEWFAGRDYLYLYGDQQQRVHVAVLGQCGDQCSTGRSGIGRGR